MDFFKVTEEDIKKVTSDGKAQFDDGDNVVFTIKELKEKDINGQKNLIVDCTVSSENEKSNGLTHAFFINDKAHSVKTWVKILRCFFSDEQIANGIDPTSLVSLSFSSVAKQSTKGDKIYTNFWDFSASEGSESVDPNDVPF